MIFVLGKASVSVHKGSIVNVDLIVSHTWEYMRFKILGNPFLEYVGGGLLS